MVPQQARSTVPVTCAGGYTRQKWVAQTRMKSAWSGRRDSNPRRPAWKAGTLPTELLPRANRCYHTTSAAGLEALHPASWPHPRELSAAGQVRNKVRASTVKVVAARTKAYRQ